MRVYTGGDFQEEYSGFFQGGDLGFGINIFYYSIFFCFVRIIFYYKYVFFFLLKKMSQFFFKKIKKFLFINVFIK